LLLNGCSLWGILELVGGFLVVLRSGSSLREMLLEATSELGLGVLWEFFHKDTLHLGIHGGLALAVVLRLADLFKTIVLLDGRFFSLVDELSSAVEFLSSLLRFTPSRTFAKLLDVIERVANVVLGERPIDDIIALAVIIITVFELAGQGITTLLTLFAASSDAHGDEAWDEEQEE
jgi:hypothetical protein